ncbi:hypothetical protein A3E49_03050 [Candidatus Saccharibacteria bacterium RIFCSPHIGHO2_12_FULL_49_19]|nr:MAG: hypothetical protein A3E49_03050 [Candidatus Saccharibacteria bacterium RIFCSPHIGHO2_12_FULL_49_19]
MTVRKSGRLSSDLLAGLNPQQRRAVKTTEGPLLILAGAGSGKTKTLTHRIAYILATGLAEPSEILAVTFTNKAAGEMRARVAQLTGHNPDNRAYMPFLGTFHAVCVRILRQDAESIGFSRSFVIWDEADRLAAVKQVSKEHKIDEKKFPARLLASMISGAKNEMVTPAEFAQVSEGPLGQAAAKAFQSYEMLLKSSNSLDFDDLIGKTVELLSHYPSVRASWQAQFKYVMIDEYQDTNSAQYKLVKLLTGSHKNIAVVGDDWQSIYSWRGADFRNILNFEKDYPSAVVIKLEQNYRSTKRILEAAHGVIKHNQNRSKKKLWTAAGSGLPVQVVQVLSEREEAEAIAQHIQNQPAQRYRDFAVLYRTNAQSRAIEDVFIRRGLPYKIVGGVRFYDRKEIKDVIAYARFIFQPDDSLSFERIANTPSRGLGAKSLVVFNNWKRQSNLGHLEALTRVDEIAGLTLRARAGLSQLADILSSFRAQMEELTPHQFIEGLIRRLDYLRWLEDGTPQGEARIENVRELLSVADEFENLGLSGFLEEVSLLTEADDRRTGGDSVVLMTLHSSKGLEFPTVFITGLEETLLPHSRALYDQAEMEEERRLMYVGMTRARRELYLTYATGRSLYGGRSHNIPSRFLADIEGSKTYTTSQADLLVSDNEPHYVPELSQGDFIKHRLFGRGTVVNLDGELATVTFDNQGTKVINIAFAPLEKL